MVNPFYSGVSFEVNDVFGVGGVILSPSAKRDDNSLYSAMSLNDVDEDSISIEKYSFTVESLLDIGGKRRSILVEFKSQTEMRSGDRSHENLDSILDAITVYKGDSVFFKLDNLRFLESKIGNLSSSKWLDKYFLSHRGGVLLSGTESSDIIATYGGKPGKFNFDRSYEYHYERIHGNLGGDLLIARHKGSLLRGGEGKDVFVIREDDVYIEDFDAEEDIIVLAYKKFKNNSNYSAIDSKGAAPWKKRGMSINLVEKKYSFYLKNRLELSELDGKMFSVRSKKYKKIERDLISNFQGNESDFQESFKGLDPITFSQIPILVSPTVKDDEKWDEFFSGLSSQDILLHVPDNDYRQRDRYYSKHAHWSYGDKPIHDVLIKNSKGETTGSNNGSFYSVNASSGRIRYKNAGYLYNYTFEDQLFDVNPGFSAEQIKIIDDSDFKQIVADFSLQDLFHSPSI